MQLQANEVLDKYIESLYDDKKEKKIEGAVNIMQLCNSPDNIQFILQHESLLSVISRTLRDEFKRFPELTLYLLTTVYCFSNYSVFHQFLIDNQIGDATLRIIDYQLKRMQLLIEEVTKKLDKMKADKIEWKKEIEPDKKKLEGIAKQQDKMICLCVQILLNLAEDFQIERKMVKRKITELLVMMLDRSNIFLLIVVITFLKKLSLIRENKTAMKELNCIAKLKRFIICPHQVLQQLSLRLLYNLSFDKDIQKQVEANGIIPILVDLLKTTAFRGLIIKIMYNLSKDDKCKAAFTYTECLPIIYQLILHHPPGLIGIELSALTINLSTLKKNAELLADHEQLAAIFKRAFQNSDVNLFKMIRNIAQFATELAQSNLQTFANEIIKLMKKSDSNPSLQVELAGILVYSLLDNWEELVCETGMVEFIHSHIIFDRMEEDIILECVMLLSTVCQTKKVAELVGKSGIITLLEDLLGNKEQDDEMVLQILCTIHKLLNFKDTRSFIIEQSVFVQYCIDMLDDNNKKVKMEVEEILDIVQYYSEGYANEIKMQKFLTHNQKYIDACKSTEEQMESNIPFSDENPMNEAMWLDGTEVANRIWNEPPIANDYY